MPTILLAENDAGVRKLILRILRGEGYEVLAAGGGEDAVSIAGRHNGAIDLLITDIVMPGMGGADVYAHLKTMQPEIRVLFISGFMSRGPLPGGFLKKPFSAAELIETVRGMLRDSS